MKYLILAAMLAVSAAAQLANTVPTLPAGITTSDWRTFSGTVMDTTYSLPTGGTTWTPANSAAFTTALASAVPGDVIVLTAGTVYSGNFTFPTKSNPLNKWIYIISSAMASLPTPGNRVSSANAANMPKIVTPNATIPFTVASGANYLRMAGIEMYSNSNYNPKGGTLCPKAGSPWPSNCFIYYEIYLMDADHMVFDRMYIHGDDASQDIAHAIGFTGTTGGAGCTNGAVIDSDIESIHSGTETQALLAYGSDGPFKFNNNYLSASTEDVMFGGASCGLPDCPHHPADIEFRKKSLV